MANFRIGSIAELSRQLTFAPLETRAAQVAAAEEALHLIDARKAYPLAFVTFKITGYHPKGVNEELLTGLALQHDLGLLIERVSGSLDVSTRDVEEPVLSIDDVCERFDVTSKTIQRWRRRGLPARRFIFADGKRRVGFLLRSVERFFSNHREQVSRTANLTLIDAGELGGILRHAHRLAAGCGCSVDEICRRIARRFSRSPQTILHTIRKFDQEHPAEAIFRCAAAPIGAADRTVILKAGRRGEQIGVLARRLGQTRGAISRVLLEERIGRLTSKKVRYIDDPLYSDADAEMMLDQMMGAGELAAEGAVVRSSLAEAGSRRIGEGAIPRDLPAYLRDLYRTPLLTRSAERALFLKFNYRKFLFVAAVRKLDPQFARSRDLRRLENLLEQAIAVKNQIVQANLRLVVSVARKHVRYDAAGYSAGNPSLMELVSEGNLTLMRAVEGFDVHKGHRLSTYATLALMKGFARSVPLMRCGGRKIPSGIRMIADPRLLGDIADRKWERPARHLMHCDEVRQLLVRLDAREREVLTAHYGLGHHEAADEPGQEQRERGSSTQAIASGEARSFEQVARRLGLSAQRVRQIEHAALSKLRSVIVAAGQRRIEGDNFKLVSTSNTFCDAR